MSEARIKIPKFKIRSLERLRATGEVRRTYPVAVDDLIAVSDCRVCGSDDIQSLAEVYLPGGLKFFATSVCRECLYVFRPISPSRRWFQACWRTIAGHDSRPFNPEMEEFRAARYERYWALLGRHVAVRTVLDVGAGYGTGARVFLDHGCQVVAVEPEESRAAYMAKHLFGLPIIQHGIEQYLPLLPPPPRYDLIIISQCLEHTDDSEYVMRSIGRLLNPGGVLYIEVPLIWGIVDWTDALFLPHKRNFTKENLSYLVKLHGFEILEAVEFQNGPDEPLDFGLVLRAAEKSQDNKPPEIAEADIDRVKQLYRKGLPEDCAPAPDQVIQYRVPYVEHFYYTMRLDGIRIERRAGIGALRLLSLEGDDHVFAEG